MLVASAAGARRATLLPSASVSHSRNTIPPLTSLSRFPLASLSTSVDGNLLPHKLSVRLVYMDSFFTNDLPTPFLCVCHCKTDSLSHSAALSLQQHRMERERERGARDREMRVIVSTSHTILQLCRRRRHSCCCCVRVCSLSRCSFHLSFLCATIEGSRASLSLLALQTGRCCTS